MAFPKLTDREILGLFDPNYDVAGVNLDIQQIIGTRLAFDVSSATTRELDEIPPENIYLNDLDNVQARVKGQTEADYIKTLSAFEKVVYNQYNPTGGGEGFAAGALNLRPINFINEFLVPKVEELVDFITLEDLEKLIENYSLSVKSLDYFYLTTYEYPKPPDYKLTRRVGDTLSGVYRIDRSFANPEGQKIERKFGNLSSNFIQNRSTKRGGVDLAALATDDTSVYTTYFSSNFDDPGATVRKSIFLDKRSNAIILEPENANTESFSNANPKNTTGQLNLSKKYVANSNLNPGFSIQPFYNQDSIPFINPEDTKKVINKIKSIEQGISQFIYTYSSLELAKIIMVRWALRTLADQIRQLRTQIGISEDDEAVVALADEILETIKRERLTNPDFDAYNEKITEDLSKLVQRRLSISPQCFLISNIVEAARLNRKRLNIPQVADYKYCRLVSNPDNTSATINKLTKRKSQKNMLSMRTDHIAKLHPYLRIYKTIFNQEGKVEREAEFKFPNFTNVQSTNKKMDVVGYVSNKYTQDYGITSFNWNFVGSDPFSYANDIDATLTLHFNDFEQLVLLRQTKDYRTGENVKYRLLDLIALSEKELQELNKLGIGGSAVQKSEYKYDIRIDVGWSGPSPREVNGFDVEDSIRTLFLAMVDYDIGFNQEGFFELTINYKARLEQTLYDRRTNVLELPTSEKKELESLQEELKAQQALSANGGTKNIDLVRQIENRISALQFDLKNRTFSNITDYLIKNSSIFSEQISSAQLIGAELVDLKDNKSLNTTQSEEAFNNLKILTDVHEAFEKSQESWYNWFFGPGKDEFKNELIKGIPEKEALFIPKKENGKYVVNFFFLGDLIEVLCKEIFEVRNFKDRTPEEDAYNKDIRVITTDFLIYDPNNLSSKKVYKVNIADLPISVDLFMSFYFEKVIKYSVSHYSLLKFIRDVISYCILNIFEECFGEDNLKSSINTAFADFEKTTIGVPFSFQDPFRELAQESNENQKVFLGDEDLGIVYDLNATLYQSYLDLTKSTKIPNIASKNERADCVHALIIHTDAFDPDELKIEPGKYNEKRKIDNENGLYHLDIGSARGILKKINFSKTDQKYLREQRYTQDVAKGFAILSNVFDVDIDLVGNSMFFPGQRVYINLGERFSALGKPYAKGFSFSKVMGMGGYHLVTSVENEISSDGYNTKIKARWETSGDGLNKDVNSGVSASAVGTGDSTSTE